MKTTLIFFLFLTIQTVHSQDRFGVVSKKIYDLTELKKTVQLYLDDTFYLLKRLNRESAFGEYTIADGYYREGKTMLLEIDYFTASIYNLSL